MSVRNEKQNTKNTVRAEGEKKRKEEEAILEKECDLYGFLDGKSTYAMRKNSNGITEKVCI